MFPTLGHLFGYFFGKVFNFPLPTYGFFLVLAFSSAGVVIFLEMKRKHKEGLMKSHTKKITIGEGPNPLDLLYTFATVFIFAFKLVGIVLNYDEFTADIHAYILSTKGNFLGGILIAGAVVTYNYFKIKKTQLPKPETKNIEVLPHQIATNIVLIAALSGITGAKLFDVIEHIPELIKDPIGTLFSSGGFTFFGGLIVGTSVTLYYALKKGIEVKQMLDVAAPAILFAYGVGRLACQLSGDGCWGIPNTNPQPEWLSFLPNWMWAYNFPHNVIHEGIPMVGCDGTYCNVLETPVFPTSFYESMLMFAFFAVVWFFRKRIKIHGILFFLAFALIGFERFLIETIRVNIKYNVLGMNLTQAQFIGLGLIAVGIAGMIYLKKKSSQLK